MISGAPSSVSAMPTSTATPTSATPPTTSPMRIHGECRSQRPSGAAHYRGSRARPSRHRCAQSPAGCGGAGPAAGRRSWCCSTTGSEVVRRRRSTCRWPRSSASSTSSPRPSASIDLDTAADAPDDTTSERADAAPKVVLSFDDGTADWPDVVLPALVERSLPATFYVVHRLRRRRIAVPRRRPAGQLGRPGGDGGDGLRHDRLPHAHPPRARRRLGGRRRRRDRPLRRVDRGAPRSTVPATSPTRRPSRRLPPPRSSCAGTSRPPRSPATSSTSPARPTSTGSGATP